MLTTLLPSRTALHRLVLAVEQSVDHGRPLVALLGEAMHARPRSAGDCRLRRREIGGQQQAEHDQRYRDRQRQIEMKLRVHRRAPGRDGVVEQAAQSCSSTSRVTKALPIPRASTKVSLPPSALLVPAHMLDQPRGIPATPVVAPDRAAQAHPATDGAEMVAHPVGIGRGAEAQPRGEVKGHRHAGADRFAMQQLRSEAGFCFQCMTKGVTEIEKSA